VMSASAGRHQQLTGRPHPRLRRVRPSMAPRRVINQPLYVAIHVPGRLNRCDPKPRKSRLRGGSRRSGAETTLAHLIGRHHQLVDAPAQSSPGSSEVMIGSAST
jgi:hypothetical protein